jgi:hypothetical protein
MVATPLPLLPTSPLRLPDLPINGIEMPMKNTKYADKTRNRPVS